MKQIYFNFKSINIKAKSIILPIVIFLSVAGLVKAEVMSSSNYKLQSDSVNFGGGRSISGSYTIEDTVGEVGTGISSSTNFLVKAGYQQNDTVNLYVTLASNVNMSPAIPGLTGGTANGETSFNVTTDDPAGYTVTISADNSPALNNSYDSFADYVPVGLDPDFAFSNSSTNSSFAFTPEGNDIAQRYKNSGSNCGIGSSDTADACWDGLSTIDKTIAIRNSSNLPLGTLTTIKFRAESGSSHVQSDGLYTATTTITVVSL